MRKFFASEVVQSSNMDCGPATLKCLLESFGIKVSYERLREACQTGIDGTSIDTMEAVANQLGLEAEQIMLPPDHVFLAAAKALPAIAVVTLANGLTHFVVLWRRHGNTIQVMDPAVGRRWASLKTLQKELIDHSIAAPAEAWLEFAQSQEFQSALEERFEKLGLSKTESRQLLDDAKSEGSWNSFAALDAATRLAASLKKAGGVKKNDAFRLIQRFATKPAIIPTRFWSARATEVDEEGTPQVVMRGAVLVRMRGKRAAASSESLPPELTKALHDKPVRPISKLLQLVRQCGVPFLGLLLLSLAAIALGTVLEAALFRGLFDIANSLGMAGQRAAAISALLLFSAGLLALELPAFAINLRIGRQIEIRLRSAFLQKLPKLGDRYFQSRLISDMAERSHGINRVRNLPNLACGLIRASFELCITGLAIVILLPSTAPLVVLTVAAGLLPAFASQWVLIERDLRVRSHTAGLTRFYLDSMLGLMAIRAHSAQKSVRREHDKLLSEWASASLRLQKTSVWIEAVQLTATFGLIAFLLLTHHLVGSDVGRALLLVYWALNMPTLSQEIGTRARQIPSYRNLTLRLLEPLGAPEEEEATPEEEAASNRGGPKGAPEVEFQRVSVEVSGHKILDAVDLTVEAGSHVAIVGPSGAGKSSLVGLLLGWLKPAEGEISIDGQPLRCEELRARTAWVDPAVQLWNRSLFANLTYGSSRDARAVGEVIDSTLLRNVLEQLPEGMQTKLGEGGGLVSGGEGQRVRFGRALLRPDADLVILDEPFRGLDREKRQQLLNRALEHWSKSTLLCITHDISETLQFDRVLVIEGGKLVEDGNPRELAHSQSRYADLLAAEESTRSELWADDAWRRIRVHAGRLIEDSPLPMDEISESESLTLS